MILTALPKKSTPRVARRMERSGGIESAENRLLWQAITDCYEAAATAGASA